MVGGSTMLYPSTRDCGVDHGDSWSSSGSTRKKMKAFVSFLKGFISSWLMISSFPDGQDLVVASFRQLLALKDPNFSARMLSLRLTCQMTIWTTST